MSPEVRAGQAVYTSRNLSLFYDLVVLRLSNSYVWRCPTSNIMAHYDTHLSARHLDVGVGTGYYLKAANFPVEDPQVTLLDINATCLKHTRKRIPYLNPETIRANVLAPIVYPGARFSSIAMTYLLHCLPGSMADKALAFDHLIPLLAPGGVLFGATIVNGGSDLSWGARKIMGFYNQKGIFSNLLDTNQALECELKSRFSSFETRCIGGVVLFSARV